MRSIPSSLFVPFFLAALSAASHAQSQPLLPFHKTSDLLIGDSAGSMILRAHDGTPNDSFNDPGELTVYFDPAVAIDPNTGTPYGSAKLTNPTAITCDPHGWIYVADAGTTRTLFRLRDNNGDGDANDPGESSIFFDGSNAGGLSNFSMQGIAFDNVGFAYVTASGQGSGFTAIDRVFRLFDFNLNGNANDPGEAVVVYDRATSIANGNTSLDIPAWIGLLPDGSLFLTNANATNQGVFRLADTAIPSNSQFNEAGETTALYTGANGNPAPKFSFCSRFGPDARLYIYNITDKRLIVAADLNGNGKYDDSSEAVAFASTGDSSITIGAGFGFDVRDDGAVIFGDTGASPNNRLILYKDGNGNGVASDPGEATVALNFSTSAFPTAKPRSVFFLPRLPEIVAPGFPASTGVAADLGIDLDGGGLPIAGNAAFQFRMTNAPFGVGIALIAATSLAPLDLNAFLPGIAPVGCTVYPDLFAPTTLLLTPAGVTDISGTLVIPAPIPAIPGIQGATLYCQGLTIDPLGSAPVITTSAISLTFL